MIIPELGLAALILALIAALLLVIIPSIGLYKQSPILLRTTDKYVWLQFIFIFAAFITLVIGFVTDDFSITYVLANSSLKLPWFYKACAVWGGHEGSMLLWVLILSIWMAGVSLFSRNLDESVRIRVLIILGAISFGFILFILTVSNPFLRQFSVLNTEGRDLNPLLQDPGFLFHPPVLYMGYVGFSVAYAFAIAGLWLGHVESKWSQWVRPWTLAAWCCLTMGITLGSWWAYRELGWGGWWFWDPVENASFMPWLAGTALIHSLMVTDRRAKFKGWSNLLAIIAFSLCLIGTFLVRSGVLTSVHAFAVDPKRGLYILGLLTLVIGGGLLLYALRTVKFDSLNKPAFLSRESALLFNNIFLLAATFTVLLGTLYPLVIDSLGLGKLSVGAPYFNTVFAPLMIPLLFLMGIGIHITWQRDYLNKVVKIFITPFFVAALSTITCMLFTPKFYWGASIGIFLFFWISLSTLKSLLQRMRVQEISKISRGYLGMMFAHLGVAVTVMGITLSSEYSVVREVILKPQEQIAVGKYNIKLLGEYQERGPNFRSIKVKLGINSNNKQFILWPEKRIYDIGQISMTESAIKVSLFGDLYVSLAEPDGEAWAMRIYIKPFIRWIWAGGFLMLFGGLLALSNRRYFRSIYIVGPRSNIK